MRIALSALAVLALAACSQSEPETEPATQASSAAKPAPSASPVSQPNIPERFQGVWDYVEGSCDPASDLRIEILPQAIEFYEAHGKITGVLVESPDTVSVELAMEGEGEQWTMERRFVLTDNGDRLVPESVGEDQFEPMPLKRCEG